MEKKNIFDLYIESKNSFDNFKGKYPFSILNEDFFPEDDKLIDTSNYFLDLGDGCLAPKHQWCWVGEIFSISNNIVCALDYKRNKVKVYLNQKTMNENFNLLMKGNTICLINSRKRLGIKEEDLGFWPSGSHNIQIIPCSLEVLLNIDKIKRERYFSKKCAVSQALNILGKCENCNAVYYCSRECQKKDWQQHKPLCKLSQAYESLLAKVFKKDYTSFQGIDLKNDYIFDYFKLEKEIHEEQKEMKNVWAVVEYLPSSSNNFFVHLIGCYFLEEKADEIIKAKSLELCQRMKFVNQQFF